jgi:hypothetical protein
MSGESFVSAAARALDAYEGVRRARATARRPLPSREVAPATPGFVPPVITAERAAEQALKPSSLAAVALWHDDRAKLPRTGRAAREYHRFQATALTRVADELQQRAA